MIGVEPPECEAGRSKDSSGGVAKRDWTRFRLPGGRVGQCLEVGFTVQSQ